MSSMVDAERILPKCLQSTLLPGASPAVGSEGKPGLGGPRNCFFRNVCPQIQRPETALKAGPLPLFLQLQGCATSNPAERLTHVSSQALLPADRSPCLCLLVTQNLHVWCLCSPPNPYILQGLFLPGMEAGSPALQADSLPSELPGKPLWVAVTECNRLASLVAQMVKNLPAMQETWLPSLGWEDPLEKGMATHSSILAWRIPWTEEPDGLQSMGSQRVRHN